MRWPAAIQDQWGGRDGGVRLVFRLVGLIVFGYVLWTQDAFGGPAWVTVLTGLALLTALAIMVLRTRIPFDRRALLLVVLMMACGAIVNPQIAFAGSVFFVIGGVILIGQPSLALRVSVPVLAVLSLLLLVVTVLHHPGWATLLGTVSGMLVVGLLGAVRRQQTIQQIQEQALATRSRELEERNAELLAQTEQTRLEAARVAALQERGRIARDLHDLLAHSLGGLVVQLDAAGAELEGGRYEQAAGRLRSSRQLAVDGLREAKAAVQQLRGDEPESADGSGPVDLVAELRAVVQGPVGLQLGARLDVLGCARPVPAAVSDALRAACREGLTNVNKHAPGSSVSATAEFGTDQVSLEIVNGLGDHSDRPGGLADTGSGAGLVGLRERFALVGGTVAAGPEGRRWVLAVSCPTSGPTFGERGEHHD